MKAIGKRLLSWRTARIARRNQSPRVSTPYKDAMLIGIIFSVVDRPKHDAITKVEKEMAEAGKKVKVLSFLGKGKDNYDFKYDFFTENDVNIAGKINAKNVHEFAQTRFDYLFCVDIAPTGWMESVLAMSRAKCRVGPYTNGNLSGCYELMIKVKDDYNSAQLFEKMLYYVKKL